MKLCWQGNGASGSGGSGDVAGPGTSTDNALARYDGTTGKLLQGGVVVEGDAGELSAITRLDVDNLRVDGNVISSTNSNGDVVIDPAGTGRVAFGGQTSSDPAFVLLPSFAASPALRAVAADFSAGAGLIGGIVAAPSDTAPSMWMNNNNIEMGSSGQLMFRDGVNLLTASQDTGLRRAAAGVLLASNASTGLGQLLAGRPVEASAAGSGAPNLLGATESRTCLTNEGATAEAYNTLSTGAPVGCEFAFYCADTDGIRVTAPTGETIRTGPGAVSAAAGFIRSVTLGSGITLTKINSTSWVAINAPNGTWLIDL